MNDVIETLDKVTTVIKTQVKTVKQKRKLGRKPFKIKEIEDNSFSVVDLINLNSSVKAPTIRAYVARNVSSGRYVLVGSKKTGGRGKPANIYKINKS